MPPSETSVSFTFPFVLITVFLLQEIVHMVADKVKKNLTCLCDVVSENIFHISLIELLKIIGI